MAWKGHRGLHGIELSSHESHQYYDGSGTRSESFDNGQPRVFGRQGWDQSHVTPPDRIRTSAASSFVLSLTAAARRLASTFRRMAVRHIGLRIPHSLASPLIPNRLSDDIYEEDVGGSNSFEPSECTDRPRHPTADAQGSRSRNQRGMARHLWKENDDDDLDCWDAVADLDRFVYGMYKYWMEGGMYAILCAHAAHLVILAFTVYFSWFLIMFVNWSGILSCTNAQECESVPLLLTSPWQPWGLRQTLCTVYLVSLSGFVGVSLVGAFTSCRDAIVWREYFRSRLHVHSDRSLQLMDWPEVVALLLQAQQQHTFCLVKKDLSVLDIVNIIMRQDNYLIAMTNKQILTRYLPSWVPAKLVYTNVLLWNIRHAIFGNLFDSKQKINANLFTSRPSDSCIFRTAAARVLANRFVTLGAFNLLLVIPLLLFNLVFFFLKYAEDVRRSHISLAAREFTCYAHWAFREFNELPHQLNHRLALAAQAADAYLYLHPRNPSLYRLQQTAKFIVGALLAVCLVVYVCDDAPILYVRIGGRNLLWCTFVLGLLYAALRKADGRKPVMDASARPGQLLSSNSEAAGNSVGIAAPLPLRKQHYPLQLYELCMRLVSFTHYLPPSWLSASWKIAFISSLVADTDDKECTAPNSRRSHRSDTPEPPVRTQDHAYHGRPFDRRLKVARSDIEKQPNRARLYSHSASHLLTYEEAQHTAFRCVSDQHRNVMKDLRSRFYSLRLQCMLEEVAAVLLAPFLLVWHFPSIADDICDFLYASTISTPFGDLCCFARLDIEAYGCRDYSPQVALDAVSSKGSPSAAFSCEPCSSSGEGVRSTRCVETTYDEAHRRWRHIAPTVLGPNGIPIVPALKRFLPTNGKLEKSALSFLLSYRISVPYDDTSPLWTVLASNELTQSLMIASARSEFACTGINALSYNEKIGVHASVAFRWLRACVDYDTDISDAAPLAPCAPIRIPPPASGLSPLIRWGLPPSAKRLLLQLEEFQRVLLQQQPFLLQEMPVSLTQMLQSTVSRQTQYSQGISDALREVCGPRPMTDEEKSSYFFWIEKVYEMNSGRVLFSTNQLNFFTRALFKQPHQCFVINEGSGRSNAYSASQSAFGHEDSGRPEDEMKIDDAQTVFPVQYSDRDVTQERQLDCRLPLQQQRVDILSAGNLPEGISSCFGVDADQESYYAGAVSHNPFEQDHMPHYVESVHVLEERMLPFPDEEHHNSHMPERHRERYPMSGQQRPYRPLEFGEYENRQ